MSPQRFQLVKRVFLDVCACEPGGRAAVLESACGEDWELRTEVESLLAQDDQSDAFLDRSLLESPALDLSNADLSDLFAVAAARQPPPTTPQRIGQYRIVDVLGEGGMGVVYRAEQDNPRRPVALKVVRPGLASAPMLRRFEYEAQILGRLHHPGIAQIYEAGTADTGYGPQPFFAMELIQGTTLGEYATATALSIHQRLELLARICDAVHYAHQKGVIHRDLKPGNILIDEFGQPKILDFGVARAVNSEPANTMSTRAGQLIGTLAYMSPEQVGGDPRDLDTRTDVYALGAIFYEILGGRLPHDMADKSLVECARIAREDEIRSLGSVDRTLRGDLETIVAKALEKDRARRYQSASELAEETRRFLTNRPIAARPPNALYQLRKFVKRNKVLVTAAVIALLAVLGLLGTALQTSRAQSERAARLTVWQSYAGLLQANLGLHEGGDPFKPRVSDRQLLDDAADWIDANSSKEPIKAATLADLLAQNYLMFEEYDRAQSFAALGLEIAQQIEPPDDALLGDCLHTTGRVLWHQSDYLAAEQTYRQALDVRIAALGPVHKDVAMTMSHIAACLRDQQRFPEARAVSTDALNMRLDILDHSHPEVFASYNSLAVILKAEGNFAEAAQHFQEALDNIRAKVGADDLRVTIAQRNIAACWIELADHRRLPEAEKLLVDALETQQHLLKGSENRHVALTLYELARLRLLQGNHALAEELCRQALAIQQIKLDENHPDTSRTIALLEQITQSSP